MGVLARRPSVHISFPEQNSVACEWISLWGVDVPFGIFKIWHIALNCPTTGHN